MGLSVNHGRVTYRYRCWRVLIIVVAICGLSVSLATRTFHFNIPEGSTANSYSAAPMRQHLDRDAVQWVAPVPVFTVLEVPTFLVRVAPAAPLLASVFFDESLSNRPPPSC